MAITQFLEGLRRDAAAVANTDVADTNVLQQSVDDTDIAMDGLLFEALDEALTEDSPDELLFPVSEPPRQALRRGVVYNLTSLGSFYKDLVRVLRPLTKSRLFMAMYATLKQSPHLFEVVKGTPPAGAPAAFAPRSRQRAAGGQIMFDQKLPALDTSVLPAVIEEFFHAYQNETLAGKGIADSNIEFESKVFIELVSYEVDLPYTNQTGAERISSYLLDKYYELRKLNGRPPHLNMPTAADFALPAFRRVYAESLQDFVRFWRAQPINNPTYTAEPNGFGPVAIISLLRKLQTP